MARKRTSLSAVLGGDATTAERENHDTVNPAREQGRSSISIEREGQGKRPGIKQQTAYLPEPVYEQLRRLAFEERRKMHDYIMEGLDRVFRDRGLASIEELTERHSHH